MIIEFSEIPQHLFNDAKFPIENYHGTSSAKKYCETRSEVFIHG